MGISTHILDTTVGRPAAGVTVRLERQLEQQWTSVAQGQTDSDGRLKPLLAEIPSAGQYRLHFEVEPYFQARQVASFYPRVVIDFYVTDATQHYHVPLLLNPFGFSTYRGS